eukprot:c10068_g1_i1.p1 GENE.c10068_g1_i1~~c10068_g1_i1.p1  ORF type:complete len:341 (+),score=70.28 c10068_g1_i1:156-1025(+)
MLGQICFLLGVANIMLMSYLFGSYPKAFVILYSIKLFPLFFIRGAAYFQNRDHFFLLDFCYFGNLLVFILLWIIPKEHQEAISMICFVVVNGPIVWAIITFHNSLVFHSVDKITSLYIHLTPALVMYCVRWRLNDEYSVCDPYQEGSICSSLNAFFFNGVLFGFIFYASHSLLYYVIVQLLCMRIYPRFAAGQLRDGSKGYWTSFRWLTRDQNSKITKFVFSAGSGFAPFLYGLINFIYAGITMCFCALFFYFQAVHFAFLVFFTLVAIWNGATFYFRVFSHGKGASVI